MLLAMSVEAEQQVAAAARLQLTWHYARLLTTKKYRQDALLRAELGPKSEEEVQAIQAELAALDADIAALRGSASSVGVISSELDRVLDALERERRLLATMVAAELRAAQSAGRYASREHARSGIPGEPVR
jgi:hypothetical protein